MSKHNIESGHLSVTVDTRGAQLCSLRRDDDEVMWGATEPWALSAPILFPIISGLPANELVHKEQRHPIASHGFARHSEFALVEETERTLAFSLSPTSQTLEEYPFSFRLDVEFRIQGSTLTITHTVSNRGGEPLPFLLGGHPAFKWPLPGAAPDAKHTVSWASGGETMRQAVGGLRPGRLPSPAVDGALTLDRSLFAEDAVLFDDIEPQRVTYSAPGAPKVIVAYDDFSRLGIWSKPHGGDFVCIEPWSGYPAPQGFTGEITELPDITLLPIGETAELKYSITIEGA
jgi:galactose mutarotase-like enzyme